MDKTLYIVWHGETLFGAQGRCEGWSDSVLTDEACEQASRAGREYFAARGIHPDRLCSSMSERACDTIELVSQEALGRVAPYERLKGLKDLNYGIYEGKARFLVPAAPYGSFFVKFGGESCEQLAKRMWDTLVGIARGEGTSILVSSHQFACAQFCGLWDEGLAARVSEAPTCSVLALDFDEQEERFSLAELYQPLVLG